MMVNFFVDPNLILINDLNLLDHESLSQEQN